MSKCWKCSTDLQADRCPSCGELNRIGDARVTGLVAEHEDARVYATTSATTLVVHVLDEAYMPTDERGAVAVDSADFAASWEVVVAEHVEIQGLTPLRSEASFTEEGAFLTVEVAGLEGDSHESAEPVEPVEPAEDSGPVRAVTRPDGPVTGVMAAELGRLPETRGDDDMRLADLKDEVTRLRSSDRDAAMAALKQQLGTPDTARRLAENLYLYSAYGRLCAETGDNVEARRALERAFRLDPRDRGVLLTYGDILSALPDNDEEILRIDRNLILHHQSSLDALQLSHVHRRVGRHNQSIGELALAQASYERALDARSDDREALDLLLETVEAQGNPEQVIKIRQRLLEQMRDPRGRAMLRVAIGDDYLSRLDDVGRAMEAYEASVAEHPNAPALTRLAKLAVEQEDWQRAVLTYQRMGDELDTSTDRASAWVEAGKIYRHHLWDPDRAASAYESVLDLEPSRLEVFRELTTLHAEAERWDELQGAYERMIRRTNNHEEPDSHLLAVLWRNLGELHRTHLDDDRSALEAYSKASELAPSDMSLHETLAEMYAAAGGDDPGSLRAAIAHNQKLLDIDPNRNDALMRMGVLHLRLKDFDEAFCLFRVLDYRGEANDDASAFLDKYSSKVLKPVKIKLTRDFHRNHLMPADFDDVLAEVLAIAKEALINLLAHDLDHYGLRPKNRIDRKAGLMFNKIYSSIGDTLGFREVPPVYEKTEIKGLYNASLIPPAFLAGAQVLSGSSEKAVAFTVAKQLSLFHPTSFLAQMRPLQDMQVIFYTIVKMFRPEVNINLNKAMERVKKSFEKLNKDRLARLKVLMDELLGRGSKINLGGILDEFEDAANKCGLLFCDDLEVARDVLSAEPNPIHPERSVEARMQVLVEFSISPAYLAIRKELGIAIDS